MAAALSGDLGGVQKEEISEEDAGKLEDMQEEIRLLEAEVATLEKEKSR